MSKKVRKDDKSRYEAKGKWDNSTANPMDDFFRLDKSGEHNPMALPQRKFDVWYSPSGTYRIMEESIDISKDIESKRIAMEEQFATMQGLEELIVGTT